MNSNQLFDHLGNIRMQIQDKRRKSDFNGMWGAPINSFMNNQQGQNQNFINNNNWGQFNQFNQFNDNGWGGNNEINGNFMNAFGQSMQMSLFSNQGQWGNNAQGYDWVRQQLKRQAFDIVNPEKSNSLNINDIGYMLQKQITFLEPSPAFQKLQQLKMEGKTFYDQRFPPNNDSLCGQYGNISQWASIKWRKISQVLPNSLIFNDKIQPGDIKQGYLGDCYFLAGLAALAQRPDRIFSLFLLKQTNNVHYFSVKLLYKGKWMTIDMDQNIPCLYNKPAFSGSIGNQLWVILLQKAWAKMYSSYKRIEAGYPEQALHDLTGAPIKQILFKQAGFDKQAQWQYLLMASQRQYSMVASSKPGSDRNKSQTGIVQGHAYTFLNATVLHFNGGSQRVVQLRNPWGKGQSQGRWSDNDPNWRLVPQSQLQRIKFTKNSNDGIFFMSYESFIKEFRALTVAQINDNASYIYKSMKDRNREGVFFKIQIFKNGYYSLHVDKTPERSFQDRVQDQYRYPEAKLELGYLNGNYCTKLQSYSSAKRTLFRGYQLNPGIYIAYVKISFDSRWQKDFDVNLAIYAQYVCDIEIATRQMVIAFTGNQNIRWNPQEHADQGQWNNLGNSRYQSGDSGWGNNNNNNKGWNNLSNNQQWNGQQQQQNQNYSNDGWGNSNNGDNGWGNNANSNGWGNNNNGWGSNNQNNWGNNAGMSNNGWGTINQYKPINENKKNDGWGDYFTNSNSGSSNNFNSQQNNNGWGDYFDNNGQKNQNQNNGWGPGW